MKLLILHGTETGNAEMIAEEMTGWFAPQFEAGHASLAEVMPDQLEASTLYLFVCSTYGDGELPGTAKSFHAALAHGGVDLHGVRFASFGLGDSQYAETYGFGSKLIEDVMVSAGAQPFASRFVHDASGSDLADEAARTWAEVIKRKLLSSL